VLICTPGYAARTGMTSAVSDGSPVFFFLVFFSRLIQALLQ
jgi:hypothetical protein